MRRKRMGKDQKERGFIVSAELILIATILVIGMIVGLAVLRDAVVQELEDVSLAIATINQSYSYTAVTDSQSGDFTAGGVFVDVIDQNDQNSVDTEGTGVGEFVPAP
jgi:hypothetical protein